MSSITKMNVENKDPTGKKILELNQPGAVIEVDPKDATDLGAFEETALSEEEALESAKDADPDN